MELLTKQCKICGNIKVMDEFPFRKDLNAYRPDCKACKQKHHMEWMKEVDYNAQRREKWANDEQWREKCKAANRADWSKSREKRLEYNRSPRRILATYKDKAKQRSISFDLSFDTFMEFWQMPCTYCGDSIDTIGIDRIDSSKGYTIENCTPCCATCNYMKRHHSLEKWIEHMQKVIDKQQQQVASQLATDRRNDDNLQIN